MSNFIGLRTMGVRLANFRRSPLSLEEKVRWAFLWRNTRALRCFNFYQKSPNNEKIMLKTVRLDFFFGSKWGFRGGQQSQNWMLEKYQLGQKKDRNSCFFTNCYAET